VTVYLLQRIQVVVFFAAALLPAARLAIGRPKWTPVATAQPTTPARTKATAHYARHYDPRTFDLRDDLYRVFGMDLTNVPGISALPAQTILCEIGADVSRFRNASAFASWLGLCPERKISGAMPHFSQSGRDRVLLAKSRMPPGHLRKSGRARCVRVRGHRQQLFTCQDEATSFVLAASIFSALATDCTMRSRLVPPSSGFSCRRLLKA
jgi:hypothetical protein